MTVNELAIAAKTDNSFIEPLWLSVYRLIVLWANKYSRHYNNPRYDVNDLIQAGYFALVRAIEQYNSDSPYKFTTYLRYYCRNEFAIVAGIRTSKREPYLYSLDKEISDEGGTSLADTVEDISASEEFISAENDIYNNQLHEALEKALSMIPKEQVRAVKAHFYEQKTYAEIAKELNCAATYPYALVKTALRALRRGKCLLLLKGFDYYCQGLHGTSYNSFRHNLMSSVEMTLLRKWDIEDEIKSYNKII
ncbi:sigma-70 family RNA polymerase sigma factor [Tyzzerella sp. OttesenSCG-928-J15]|nr:sigma-70 family RNA polymerase sigma factor [Tyzzerella sp. OttesenSCG-928-J15]